MSDEKARPLVDQDPWAKKEIVDQVEGFTAERMDAYKNELTGIGDFMRDKRFGGREGGVDFVVRFLSNIECENRWRGSDLGHRIVECIPDEMTREGWKLAIQPDEEAQEKEKTKEEIAGEVPDEEKISATEKEADDLEAQIAAEEKTDEEDDLQVDQIQEKIEAVEGKLDELSFVQTLTKALQYERAFGGAAIWIGANDGKPSTQELDETRIKSIDAVNVFTGGIGGELIAYDWYNDWTKPKYGMPRMYMLRSIGVPLSNLPAPGETPIVNMQRETVSFIHESRLLIFPGKAPSLQARVQNRGWGDSIFTRVDDVLSDYSQTWGGIANLMTDWSQGILKMEGLNAKLGTPNSPLAKKAVGIQMTRSIARMIIIDSKEEFSRETASLAGLDQMVYQMALRVSAAADMPFSLLFGQVQGGLGDASKGDANSWNNRVAARQRQDLLPNLKRFLKLLMLAKQGPTSGQEPVKWSVKFNPFTQMTLQEIAQLRKTVAETDAIQITNQVLTPEEVAIGTYGGSEWSMERVIDLKTRATMKEKREEALENTPPGMPPGTPPGTVPPGQEPDGEPDENGEPDGETSEEAPEEADNESESSGEETEEDLSEEEVKDSLDVVRELAFHLDAEWNEEDHPRAEDGKFGEGSGGSAAKKEEHPRVAKARARYEKSIARVEAAKQKLAAIRERNRAQGIVPKDLAEKEARIKEGDRKLAEGAKRIKALEDLPPPDPSTRKEGAPPPGHESKAKEKSPEQKKHEEKIKALEEKTLALAKQTAELKEARQGIKEIDRALGAEDRARDKYGEGSKQLLKAQEKTKALAKAFKEKHGEKGEKKSEKKLSPKEAKRREEISKDSKPAEEGVEHYHGTPASNVESILKNGIAATDKTMGTKTAWVATSPNLSHVYAAGKAEAAGEKEYAVVVVKSGKDTGLQNYRGNKSAAFSFEGIKPEHIERVEYYNLEGKKTRTVKPSKKDGYSAGDITETVDTFERLVLQNIFGVNVVDEWNEEDHPRAENGQFGEGGGGAKAEKKSEAHEKKERSIAKAQKMGASHEQIKSAQALLDPHEKHLEANTLQLKGALKDAEVTSRVKEVHSALEKVVRKPDEYSDVSKLQDMTGMRAVAKDIASVKENVERIRENFKVIAEENAIDNPKGDYRSYHMTVETKTGQVAEIQIRTPGQHAFAEWAHDVYKPVKDSQRDALRDPKFRNEAMAYSKAISEHIFAKDSGKDAGVKPQPSKRVREVFGEVKL